MKEIEYRPSGVCSRMIKVSVDDDGIIRSAAFTGGCSGNTAGISKLVVGMKAKDVAALLKGTKCGYKNTSCPDQLAKALEKFEEE